MRLQCGSRHCGHLRLDRLCLLHKRRRLWLVVWFFLWDLLVHVDLLGVFYAGGFFGVFFGVSPSLFGGFFLDSTGGLFAQRA